jgi:hypothetical protein
MRPAFYIDVEEGATCVLQEQKDSDPLLHTHSNTCFARFQLCCWHNSVLYAMP